MNNPSAFPRPGFDGASEAVEQSYRNQPQDGMTLRDYFAAKALQGMLASNDEDKMAAWRDASKAAAWSYLFADAMLAEREKHAASGQAVATS